MCEHRGTAGAEWVEIGEGVSPFSVGSGSDGFLVRIFWLSVVHFGVYSDKNSSRDL